MPGHVSAVLVSRDDGVAAAVLANATRASGHARLCEDLLCEAADELAPPAEP
jgi:hypothetical protein